ncbi:MAG: MBL fold metallo-hydrolase [Eubacteriales bacterium]
MAFLKVMPRLRTVKMEEQEVLPGITITPRHTPGSISVLVNTSEGPYVITGDAVACYEKLEGDPAKGLKYIPTGIYTDLIAMWNSMALIHSKALIKKDHVLPGHEIKVFRQMSYPTE